MQERESRKKEILQIIKDVAEEVVFSKLETSNLRGSEISELYQQFASDPRLAAIGTWKEKPGRPEPYGYNGFIDPPCFFFEHGYEWDKIVYNHISMLDAAIQCNQRWQNEQEAILAQEITKQVAALKEAGVFDMDILATSINLPDEFSSIMYDPSNRCLFAKFSRQEEYNSARKFSRQEKFNGVFGSDGGVYIYAAEREKSLFIQKDLIIPAYKEYAARAEIEKMKSELVEKAAAYEQEFGVKLNILNIPDKAKAVVHELSEERLSALKGMAARLANEQNEQDVNRDLPYFGR